MRLFVGDGAIELVEAVARHLVGDVALARLELVQPDACDLRIGERGPGDHRVIGAKFPEFSEQRIHRRVPRLMRGGVRELIGAGDVAAGVNVRIHGLQVFVGLDRARSRHRDAELLEPIARGVRDAAQRA